MKQLIEHTPIPLAGLALGVIALGGLLRTFSVAAYWVCFVLSALLLAMVLARAIMFTADVRAEMRNPMIASTSGTFWLALMQIGAGLNALAPQAAFILWLVAVAGHTVLIAWFTAVFVPHFEWKNLMPSWFIVYVGILMAAATAPTFGLTALAQVLFWVSMALCVVLLVLVFHRLRTIPLPEGAKPMICILAAPFSLGLTAYLAAYPQPSAAFAVVMLVFAQVLYFFVLFQVPKLLNLLHGRFLPSMAAMTFPFAISATAIGRACTFLAQSGIAAVPFLDGLAVVEAVLAVALVAWVLVRYAGHFAGIARHGTAQ